MKRGSKMMNRKPRPAARIRGIRRSAILLAAAFLAVVLFAIGYHYKEALSFYFADEQATFDEEDKVHLIRNLQVMSSHPYHLIGFDVSQYQGEIDWEEADTVDNTFPLRFVFIRATAGVDVVDKEFIPNWIGSKKKGIVRGAYHYYRPNENSIEQADNFIKTVQLFKGDLPPVLDIEKQPDTQSIDSLKKGLRRWLQRVEKHYKVKPIIYSGEKYYQDFLKDEFPEYEFWIANYNFFVEKIQDDWAFWQFTERASVKGIEGDVDINIFNGSEARLKQMTKRR